VGRRAPARGGGFHEHTLLALVRARDPKWSPVHRLGRGTSGLVVFASGGAAALSRLFREREVVKRYLGRVAGALEPQTITAPIGLVPHARMGRLHAVTEGGRFAQTVVERVDGDVAQVLIVTGRPHQIRIHLAHAGAPLKGDPLYAAHGALLDARPGDLGYELRAWRLAFTHPVTKQPLQLESELPLPWSG
jgi:23S rRNA pseudouridine1911/1915/1917 synthase